MPQSIRYHLDESCRTSIAVGLRRHGIDVTTTTEAGLIGATDEIQLDYAKQTGRVLLTHDSDFVELHGSTEEHAGLIYCHQNSRTVGEIVRLLKLYWELYDTDEMVNVLESL